MDVIDHQQTELQAKMMIATYFFYSTIIANRCLKKTLYSKRYERYIRRWFISEKLKYQYQGKIRYEGGESGKQNRAGRMPEKKYS